MSTQPQRDTAGLRLVVDAWDPAYGTGYAVDDDLEVPERDLDVEQPAARWLPVDPPDDAAAGEVVFVDGVQRVDARITVLDGEATTAGIAGSFAAGAVRHRGSRAAVEAVHVRRGVFTQASDIRLSCGGGVVYAPYAAPNSAPETLVRAMTEQMRALEKVLALDADAELVVLDGPLSGHHPVAGAVGLVKSHRRPYLEGTQQDLVARLRAGQRTPVFLAVSSFTRYSWYLRLPGPVAHPWAGIVRCEAAGDLPRSEALRLAGVTAATLPRFASAPHRDPRAPQNLTCIGELERHLRHRLGDARILERMLRRTCAVWRS